MPSQKQHDQAVEIVAYYTIAATATGAIPVPAASAAVVAEDAIMLTHLGGVLGKEISIGDVAKNIGMMTSANLIGRQVFIEGARLLGWGTGNVWAAIGVSALGAATAGVQTYIIGRLAIAMAGSAEREISRETAEKVVTEAKESYDDFVRHWSVRNPQLPH